MAPHIIMIMTDQQRSETIGALGYDYMITPNIDRIYREGVAFTNAYTCGATCVSARAALFTGMYAHNTGTYSFNNWAHQRGWVHDLRDAGYHCVNIGKMHLTPRDDAWAFHERVIVENPTNKAAANGGADDDWGRYLSLHGVERPNDRNFTDPNWHAKHQGVPWEEAEHLQSDVFIGNSALGWIRRHKSNAPVFLQIGFTGPHEPYDPLPRHFEAYRDRPVPPAVRREGELDSKPIQHRVHGQWHHHTTHESSIDLSAATDDEIAHMRRCYYANVTTIDEKIGEILAALEEHGYLHDALVVFTSDHGDMLGDHSLAYKWLMYDGAVRVPLAFWRPGAVNGSHVDTPTSHIDVGPSILEAAGVRAPSYLEGQALFEGPVDAAGLAVRDRPGAGAAPAGAVEATEVAAAATEGAGGSSAAAGAADWVSTAAPAVFCEDNYLIMVRRGRFKYVHYIFQEEECELYDLEADPNELTNLFGARSDIVGFFREEIARWMTRSCYITSTYKNRVGIGAAARDRSTGGVWPLLPQDGGHLHPGGLRTQHRGDQRD